MAETMIPVFLVSWLQLIAPDKCYEEFFEKFNFLHGPCLKIAISKCLGYGIIVGSSIVKLPQVVKIFQAKSGEGISLASVTLELVAISASWAYSAGNEFPFSSYGEAIFLAVQTSSIAAMCLLYSGRTMHSLTYMSVYVGAMGFLLSPAAPAQLLNLLQASNLVMVIVGKLIQIVANLRAGSTGQLSVVTQLLLFLGAVARVFTSMQETGDTMVVASYVLSSLMNGIIFSQILFYWNSVNKGSLEGKKKQ